MPLPARADTRAIGVDVGGTFTDIVISGPGGLAVLKLPTSSEPSAAILAGIRRLGKKARGASILSHATTLATNALLTRSGLARTALVTNDGFRDILEIARQRRPELYDLDTRRPPPLVERRDRLTVRCRVGPDGTEIEPITEPELGLIAQKVVAGGFESVAVCFLNSYANGTHEEQVRAALRRNGFRGHVSISSEVDREYREYERMSTTAVNAVLTPLISGYLRSLERAFRLSGVSAPIYMMNSDGGASTVRFASARPVTVIESGPAAGVVASRELARKLSLPRVLTFDMGGTTAKAGAVLEGEAEITEEFEAAGRTHSGRSIRGSGYAVRGEFIDLAEVSAGGGTIAWVDEGGELQAGPKSAASHPGPACYGKGGTEPTVTDANVVLGRLNPTSLLGGSMPISRDLALKSVRGLSEKLGIDEVTVAAGIIRLVNNSMARAISMVTVGRGRDPRDFVMVAFGGAGPVQACDLAEEMELGEIIVPAHAGLFSAYGLLAGELSRTFTAPVMKTEPLLRERFEGLRAAAMREMRSEGFRKFATDLFFEGRYLGQSHELLLPFVSDARTRASFDRRHRELYGYSLPDKLEVVNIRLRATVHRAAPELLRPEGVTTGSRPGRRRAWVGGRHQAVAVHAGSSLENGAKGRGPCIIEEYDSTIVVNPGWRWSSESYGTRLTR